MTARYPGACGLIPPATSPYSSVASKSPASVARQRLPLLRRAFAVRRTPGPMHPVSLFHPAVAAWFDQSFAAPTAAQAEAWPAIHAGHNVLIAAPTGSGKTLAAFLAAIDALARQGIEGRLKDETQVVYISPLKALSNDIRRNLEIPLAGIRETLRERGLP